MGVVSWSCLCALLMQAQLQAQLKSQPRHSEDLQTLQDEKCVHHHPPLPHISFHPFPFPSPSLRLALIAELEAANLKVEAAKSTKAYMDSKLADVEKERTMLELELNETISRSKTSTTEKIARLAQAEERIVVFTSKLKQKSEELDSLLAAMEQDRASEPLPPSLTLPSCPSPHAPPPHAPPLSPPSRQGG